MIRFAASIENDCILYFVWMADSGLDTRTLYYDNCL